MPLAPEIQALVEGMAQNPDSKPTHELSPKEAREGYVALAQMFGPGEEVATVEDRSIPGPAGSIPVRVYRPEAGEPLPIVVFYHGGGWVIGDLDTHDRECRALANGGRALVVSVDYRLAPEHPFPAAIDDSFAALQWLGQHGAELGGDPTRMAVAGDSAGGNLSAAVALRARDAGGPDLRAQLLVYPSVDLREEAHEIYPSRKENAAGPFLLKESMDYFGAHYFGPDGDPRRSEPDASPLLATNHAGLPPALIATAEFDPLRDEGEAYGKALEAAGVPVTVHRYDGMPHVFFQLSPIVPAGKALLQEMSDFLRGAFRGSA